MRPSPPPAATRLPAVIALFGVLCLCLVAWADLRWRAVLVDSSRSAQLVDQIRLHLRAAQVQATHLQEHDSPTSFSGVEADLDDALLSSGALLAQLRSIGTDSPHTAELIASADQLAQQVLRTRQMLQHQPPAQTRELNVRTLQALHGDLDSTVRRLERLTDEIRQERLQRQGWLSMVTLALIALGSIGLGVAHQRRPGDTSAPSTHSPAGKRTCGPSPPPCPTCRS